MPKCITMPGTLTNVTPDMLAPTIPNATMYHGDCLPAKKKALFLLFLTLSLLTASNNRKYVSMTTNTI